jgi:hypothetical protein
MFLRQFERTTTCPFCGRVHEVATELIGSTQPEDGDTTMCFRCGIFSIFDAATPGGLRKPTKREQRRLDRDPQIRKISDAWHETQRGTPH